MYDQPFYKRVLVHMQLLLGSYLSKAILPLYAILGDKVITIAWAKFIHFFHKISVKCIAHL